MTVRTRNIEDLNITSAKLEAAIALTQAQVVANSFDGTIAKNAANVNIIGGIPVVHRVTCTTLTGDVDVVLTHKTRVLAVHCVATAAGGGGDTVTVGNGASAITDAMDLNVGDKVVVRAATVDDAQHEIAAGGTLRVSGASAVNAEVYITGIRVA